jgi:hypothetical protein
LSGEKVFTTDSGPGTALFVVATTGTSADGKPALKVARTSAAAVGVTLSPMDELPFVPEVPHANLKLDQVVVAAAEVLEGDGYARYLKPFRTVEDLHVNAAVLGYLASVAHRFGWPAEVKESLLALVATGVALSEMPVDAPETHLALAGFLSRVRALIDSAGPHFDLLDAAERTRW